MYSDNVHREPLWRSYPYSPVALCKLNLRNKIARYRCVPVWAELRARNSQLAGREFVPLQKYRPSPRCIKPFSSPFPLFSLPRPLPLSLSLSFPLERSVEAPRVLEVNPRCLPHLTTGVVLRGGCEGLPERQHFRLFVFDDSRGNRLRANRAVFACLLAAWYDPRNPFATDSALRLRVKSFAILHRRCVGDVKSRKVRRESALKDLYTYTGECQSWHERNIFLE